jgi:hypothetical protein
MVEASPAEGWQVKGNVSASGRTIMRKSVLRIVIGIFLGLLAGCGQGDSNPQGSAAMGTEFRFSVPFTHIAGLTATLEISGVGTFPMTVNPDGTVSVTVAKIPTGLHTFTLTYYANGVILAQASTEAEIVTGQNTNVAFETQDLNRNFDDDFDGWVNLAEVLCLSDPLSADSRCPGEDPRFALMTASGSVQSASYTMHDSVGQTVEKGSGTGGPYTLSGGFQAYP